MFKKMIHKLGFNLYKSTYTLAVALLIAGSVFAHGTGLLCPVPRGSVAECTECDRG